MGGSAGKASPQDRTSVTFLLLWPQSFPDHSCHQIWHRLTPCSSCPLGSRAGNAPFRNFLFSFLLPAHTLVSSAFTCLSPNLDWRCTCNILVQYSFLSWTETQILLSHLSHRTFYFKLFMITKRRKRMNYNLNFKNVENFSFYLFL